MNTDKDIKHDTQIGIEVTDEMINQAEQQLVEKSEALASLERLIGTYETYGAALTVAPELSKDAVIPTDLLRGA